MTFSKPALTNLILVFIGLQNVGHICYTSTQKCKLSFLCLLLAVILSLHAGVDYGVFFSTDSENVRLWALIWAAL